MLLLWYLLYSFLSHCSDVIETFHCVSWHFLTVLWFQQNTFAHPAFSVGGPMAWNSLLDNLHDPSHCSSRFTRGLITTFCEILVLLSDYNIEMLLDFAIQIQY